MACVLAVHPDLPFLFYESGTIYPFYRSHVYVNGTSPVLPSCTDGHRRKLLCFVDVDNQQGQRVVYPPGSPQEFRNAFPVVYPNLLVARSCPI